MKEFLIVATVADGEHEHTHFALHRARNAKSANKWADAQAGESGKGYFNYSDETTVTKISRVSEISKKDAAGLVSLGVAFHTGGKE